MKTSKTHLVSVRVDERINAEIEELLSDTGRDKPEFLREVLVRGLYSYRTVLYQSHSDNINNALAKSYYAYEREMLDDDDLLYITARFDRLEAIIQDKEPVKTPAKLPKPEEKKTIFNNLFKK